MGVGHQITDNAIVGNGSSAATSEGGLVLTTKTGAGAPENVIVRDNEFDNNWGSHIYHEGYNCWFYQNRFIQDATTGTGGIDYRNSAIMYLDATVSGACFNNLVSNNSVRFDNATTETIYGYAVIDVANTFNNAFVDNTWSPSAYAINPSYVTQYSFPVTRPRLYAVERGIQIAGSDQAPYGFQQTVVTVVGVTVNHTSAPSQIKLVGSYNPVINSTQAFNDSTWTFTVPYYGLLSITSNIIFRPDSSALNQSATIYVYKNGSAYHTQYIPQGFQVTSANQNYTFNVVVPVDAGDTITMYASVAAGGLISRGDATSTTTFQML